MGNAEAHSRRGNTSDDYKTPLPCIRGLLEAYKISKTASILDPCCGTKAIGNTLREYGYENITEYDINFGFDFHKENRKFDYIIMNPPYSDKVNFMFKAFTLAKEVIVIFPQNMTNYNEFQSLFMDMQYFVGKYLMRPKFFMTAEDTENPKRGGVSAYGWFIWKTNARETKNGSFEKYINLNKYFPA